LNKIRFSWKKSSPNWQIFTVNQELVIVSHKILNAEHAANNQIFVNTILKGILAIVVIRKNLTSIIHDHWAIYLREPTQLQK